MFGRNINSLIHRLLARIMQLGHLEPKSLRRNEYYPFNNVNSITRDNCALILYW